MMVNIGTININLFNSVEIYHYFYLSLLRQNQYVSYMTTEKLNQMYQVVCNAPGGNGFRVETMSEQFATSEIDDCMAHVHSFYEIIWFQEGEGHHTVDFLEYEVRPGTIFFLSPGQIHHYDRKDGYKGVTIKMCTDLMKDNTAGNTGIGKMFLKYNAFHAYDSSPYYTIDETTAKMLLPLVDEMSEESLRYGEYGNIDILKSLLTIFMAKIERYGKHETVERLDTLRPSHQLFIQFRRMVEKEYTRLHTVQEYADRLNVAIRTLHKSVNECSGRTPLALINERIILEAKRMVRYTNMMIKEIAIDLGYDDPSYFVKLFKRHTGFLPSDFREMENVTDKYIQNSVSIQRTKGIQYKLNEQLRMNKMTKIAVPSREGMVDDNFGHCDHYTVFTIDENRQIVSSERLDSPQGCGCKSNIASTMQKMGITVMLAGNMGMGAYNKLSQHDISVLRGCRGKVEDVINAFLEGSLTDSAESCDHHDCQEPAYKPVF